MATQLQHCPMQSSCTVECPPGLFSIEPVHSGKLSHFSCNYLNILTFVLTDSSLLSLFFDRSAFGMAPLSPTL